MSLLSRVRLGSTLFMNTVFKGAQPTRRQRPRAFTPRNTDKELNVALWKNLLTYGRSLYGSMGEVKGAINEKANYTVGNAWIPQFYGKDKEWGQKAEDWIWEWMKICDVRGPPFDFRTSLRLDSIHIDRDGDVCTVLTETENGYPQIQHISAHRIGSRQTDGIVESGSYKGFRILNGIIKNPAGRAIAYNILGDESDGSQDLEVSARDMIMLFDPDWCDQNRGITALYASILPLMDTQDIHEFLLTAIKTASTVDLIEKNEDGEIDSAADFIRKEDTTNQVGADKSVYFEELENQIRVFKAGTGSGIEVINDQRPSPNTSEFIEKVLRGCYQGIEWPYEFTRDASKIGGANVRVVVRKIRRTIEKRQMLQGIKAVRVVGYAISKAIKGGELPHSDEWWMWDFQMPEEFSVDDGNDRQQDREDYKMGMKTLRDIYGKRGQWWEEQVVQRVKEAKFIQEECIVEGVDIRSVQLLTPNEAKDPNAADLQKQDPNQDQTTNQN